MTQFAVSSSRTPTCAPYAGLSRGAALRGANAAAPAHTKSKLRFPCVTRLQHFPDKSLSSPWYRPSTGVYTGSSQSFTLASQNFVRDDFAIRTKEWIAKRAGYVCSNPECGCATVGAAKGDDSFANVGVAAHITAAAPGGPRYDPALTPEQRQDQSNGIWLCQNHAHLIDSDTTYFSVEKLRQWKREAESRSASQIFASSRRQVADTAVLALEATVQALVDRLGLPPQDDIESVTERAIASGLADLAAFRRAPGWPQHPLALNLRVADGPSEPAFHVSRLAAAIQTFREIAVVAPPGTGKTTTLLQAAEALLSETKVPAVFLPLGEWSAQTNSFFASLVRRSAFRNLTERHLALLAYHGRLVLILDGWNELDATARHRAAAELSRLRRDFPQLGLIASTRRQALDLPVSGLVVTIDLLTEEQQLTLAREMRGEQGARLVDQAWRTSGIRELIAIPLYLAALLTRIPDGRLPTTKEEVLRLLVEEHERSAEKAAVLRDRLFGFHPEMLTALAVDATSAANTAISDDRARSVIRRVEDELLASGQISSSPQPTVVLDTLVSHHALTRSATAGGVVSFQHQQIQEWYGSFHVEKLMRAAFAGDNVRRELLRADVLNVFPWEESVLFAIERISREPLGDETTAATILLALPIDPMLAAEMIFRSSTAVWLRVKDAVIAFVDRWHAASRVDRAVRFMITTGREEFSAKLWPLISSSDLNICLTALRAAKRFRSSTLGPNAEQDLRRLPPEIRKAVLSEIALASGFDGMELAVTVAKADANSAIQVAVIESLHFRRADRHVLEILTAAKDDVWNALAQHGHIDDLPDDATRARLRAERERQFREETNPLTRLGLLLRPNNSAVSIGTAIAEVIEADDFPINNQYAVVTLKHAFDRFPEEVRSALLRRLAAGRELPFHTDEFLIDAPIMDEGPIAGMAIDPDSPPRVAGVAVTIVGPKTVGDMIDRLVSLSDISRQQTGGDRRASAEAPLTLLRRIASTRITSLAEAAIRRGDTTSPRLIAQLAELLARHGNDESRKAPLLANGELARKLIALTRWWVETLLISKESTRYQLAQVGVLIGRLMSSDLMGDLKKLLDADLARWRAAKDAFRNSGGRLTIEQRSEAAHSWTLQYRQAFERIAGEPVGHLMQAYLEDIDFGFDAALVLRAVYDREQKVPPPDWTKPWPDLSGVRARRASRGAAKATEHSSSHADCIFAAIERLIGPDSDTARQMLAIRMGRVAISMPHGDQRSTIDRLLAVPVPIRAKRELLAALVLDGEVIGTDMVMSGVEAWIEDAKAHTWQFRDGLWEIQGWLELLPFTERPETTIDGVDRVMNALPHPDEMRQVVSALIAAPTEDAEQILGQLLKLHPQLVSNHEWAEALIRRGTARGTLMIIDLVIDGTLGDGRGGLDRWWISRQLAALARSNNEIKSALMNKHGEVGDKRSRDLIESALAELGGTDCLHAMIRSYASSGRSFDGTLNMAIRNAAINQEPVIGWPGAFEMRPTSLAEVRKDLFAMLSGTTS